MGRAYSKLGKCNELLSHHKVQSQFHLNEALKYFNKYCLECEYLFDNYVKSYYTELSRLEMKRHLIKSNEEITNVQNNNGLCEVDEPVDIFDLELEVHNKMKELCEQIYIDYDASYAKLANFYTLMDIRMNR